jgi:beta-lactam-binding protein with PASTA domain
MPKKLFSALLFSLILLNLFFLTALAAFHVTKRGEVSSVPDLTGKTMDAARSIIDERKLLLIQSGIELHPRYEKGLIIAQIPPSDSKVSLYSTVRVILSAGKEKVIAEGFIGRSLQAILPSLTEAGLRKGSVTHVHSRRYSAGRIFGQFPLPDQEVPMQSPINFLVSEGEEEAKYLMPDLLGKPITAARAKLEEMGFRLGPIRRSYYRGYEPGIIINQSPKQGNPVMKRNTITLEVTK